MFCQKCGNQLNEGASFCPKCGLKIDAAPDSNSQEQVQYNQPNVKQIKHKESKKRNFVTLFVILILFFMAMARMHVNNELERITSVNAGKGAEDPSTIGRDFALCCQYKDTSYIDKYLDDELNYDSFIAQIKDIFQSMDEQNYGDINLDGVTCELGEKYEKNGYTCVDLTVNFAEEGLFGGNTRLGNKSQYTFPLHRVNVMGGNKWFIGIPELSY